jgi:hypothetical protein
MITEEEDQKLVSMIIQHEKIEKSPSDFFVYQVSTENGGVTQVVDHLSSKCEILQSNPCQKKEKKSQW